MPNINTNGDPIESANGLKFFCMGADGGVGWFSPDALEDYFSERMLADSKILGGYPSLEEFFSLRPFLSLYRTRPGLWYDPQDLASMYQDAAGTLPVYRPGSGAVDPPVGLLLDKSMGLELGPELWDDTYTPAVANAGGTGGSYNVSTKEFSNTIAVAGSTAIPAFSFSPLISSYRHYRVRVAFSGNIAKILSVTLNKSSSSIATSENGTISGDEILSGEGVVEKTLSMQNPAGVPGLRIATDGTTTWGGLFIESISIREIKGYHAYQTTTTARPTLSGRYNQLDATETLSTQSVTTAATDYTFRFEGAGTVTLSGTATGTYSAGTHTITCTAGTLTLTVDGSVTKADLRVKRDGSSLPPYQRVDSATTYDTVGFPLYLWRDKVDDDLIVQAPSITGSWAHGTIDGPVLGSVAIPAGEYSPFGEVNRRLETCTQWIAIDGTLTATEQAVLERYVYSKARQLIDVPQFQGISSPSAVFAFNRDVTEYDFSNYDFGKAVDLETAVGYTINLKSLDTSSWNLNPITCSCAGFARSDANPSPTLISVDLSGLAPVSITEASAFLYKRTGLQAVDISMLDFSQCTTCRTLFFQCLALTTVTVGNAFDNTPCTNFEAAFTSTKLNQASIDAILVSINTAGTSNGTFEQSGGSAPSATGQAAITAMRSRGWTVTVTGGF